MRQLVHVGKVAGVLPVQQAVGYNSSHKVEVDLPGPPAPAGHYRNSSIFGRSPELGEEVVVARIAV